MSTGRTSDKLFQQQTFQQPTMSSSSFRTITVAGATGTLGYFIAEALLNDGSYKVKILRKEPKNENKKADLLASKGAEIFYVDYSQKDGLTKCLKGTDVLISALNGIDPGNDFYAIQSPMIAAAKEAGVKRVIPSEFGCAYSLGVHPFTDPKAKVREELEKSGLEYTYIYCGIFQEYLTWAGFDVKNKTATFHADGSAKVSSTCMPDVAKYTVESLKMPAARNAGLTVIGATLSLNEYLQKFEEATGSKWKVVEDKDIRKRFQAKTAPVPSIMEDFIATIHQAGELSKVDNDKFSFSPVPLTEIINTLVKQ